MTRKEKAAQMVMAGNPDGSAPSTADITTYAPGAVFSPGGASPPGGITKDKWAAMVDGYIDAAAKSAHQIPILYGVDAVHGMNASSDARFTNQRFSTCRPTMSWLRARRSGVVHRTIGRAA